MTDDKFTEFWALYPHKVGKRAAEKKYWAVRKDVEHGTLMTGLRNYIASKPEGRAWCNPLTWLNQGRWEDEPDNGASTTREAFELPPTPSYLKPKPPARVVLTAEEKARREARFAVFDDLRREGIDPYQVPSDEIRQRIAQRQRKEG